MLTGRELHFTHFRVSAAKYMAKDLDTGRIKHWGMDIRSMKNNSIYQICSVCSSFSCVEVGMLNVDLTKKYGTTYTTLSCESLHVTISGFLAEIGN